MKTRILQIPDKDYSYVPTVLDDLSFNVKQFGKEIIIHPRIQKPASYFLANNQGLNIKGATLFSSNPDDFTAVVPYDRAGEFLRTETLPSGETNPNAVDTQSWTQTNADMLASWIATNRPFKFLTDSFDEAYGSRGNYIVSSLANNDVFYRVYKTIADAITAKGGEYYGTYAGAYYAEIETQQKINNVRAALLDNNTALTGVRIGGNINHRSTPQWEADTTWPDGSPKPNMMKSLHCLVQTYVSYSVTDSVPSREVAKSICSFIVAKNALTALNSPAKLMNFMWLTETQPTTDYFAVDSFRTLDNGGVVKTRRFPIYPFTLNLSLVLYGLIYCDRVYCWEDNFYYSTDKNSVQSDGTGPEGSDTYTGPSITRHDSQLVNYDPNQSKSSYFSINNGFDDAMPIAAKWFEYMGKWSGTTFVPYPIRVKDTSAFSATTKDAVLTAYEAGGAYCIVSKSGSHYSIVVTHFGPTLQHYEINLDGVIWKTIEQNDYNLPLTPNVTYAWIVDIADSSVNTTQAVVTTQSIATTVSTGTYPQPATPAYLRLPRSGFALYNQSVNPRDYGNGPEDRSAYEQYGLQTIQNNDGPIIPFLPLFKNIVTANGTRTIPEITGGYITAIWSDFKVGSSINSVWTPGNLSAAWKRLITNQLNYARDNGMTFGIGTWGGRESGFSEFITNSDRTVSHNGAYSTYNIRTPAPRQFAKLKNLDVNNIDTSTAAGKYLADLKQMMAFLKQFYVDGSLTFIMPGLLDNGEFGYNLGTRDNAGFGGEDWGDWSPDEIIDLQTYLKGLYSNNLGSLNSAWFGGNTGSYFNSWNDVTLPYTGDFGDFKGQRGIDCQKFRHIRLGDAAEAYARVIWSELRGIPIILGFGQPFGGQGGVVSQIDLPYYYKRVQKVANELGITTPCVGGKCNPEPGVNYKVRARYMAYRLKDALGYDPLLMQESTYENGSIGQTALSTSTQLLDFNRYGNTGGQSSTSSFAVLFNSTGWQKSDGVSDMFTRFYNTANRNDQAISFGTTNPAKIINITMNEFLNGMGNGVYPFFAQKSSDWQNMNGENEDVRFNVEGFNIPV